MAIIRLAIILSTHMSPNHLTHLQTCWPNMLIQSPMLSRASIFIYATSYNISESWTAALARLPNNQTMYHKYNQHYVNGAVAPMRDPAFVRLIDPALFDWILRLNPDVVIYNIARVENMMHDPNVDAILAACAYKDECQQLSGCTKNHVHTDFTVFRAKLFLNMSLVIGQGHAEAWMRDQLHDVVANHRERWISTHNQDRDCRLRIKGEIMHEHRSEGCSGHRLQR